VTRLSLHQYAAYQQRVWGDLHVEALIPVGIQRLFDHTRSPCLFAIDRGDSEWVGKPCCLLADPPSPLSFLLLTEDIPLV
jgi:hypothetical protein